MWKRKWRVAVSAYGILFSIVALATITTLIIIIPAFLDSLPHFDASNKPTIVYMGVIIYFLLGGLIMGFAFLIILVPSFAILTGYCFLIHLLATKCSERFKGKIRFLISFFVHLIFCLISCFVVNFLVYFYSYIDPDPHSIFLDPIGFGPATADPDPYSIFSFPSFNLHYPPFYWIYLIVAAFISIFVAREVLRYLDQRNNRRLIQMATWIPITIGIILLAIITIFLLGVEVVYVSGY